MYRPPRFMSIGEAVAQLLELEERLQQGVCSPGRVAIGLARVGAPSQQMVAGECRARQHYHGHAMLGGLLRTECFLETCGCMAAGSLADLQQVDFGAPLHSLVIPGHLHEMERDMVAALTLQTADNSDHT